MMSDVVPVEVDRLFVHTLGDLENRAAATDEYTVLMSAGLLRKLLLDQERLVDQVNRSHRLSLRFRISDVSPYEQLIYQENPMFWAIEDALDPESPLAYAPRDATRDQFLNRRVMRCDGRWITVRDVIDHLANFEGAVHRGTARTTDRERCTLRNSSFTAPAYRQRSVRSGSSHGSPRAAYNRFATP